MPLVTFEDDDDDEDEEVVLFNMRVLLACCICHSNINDVILFGKPETTAT